MEPDGASSISVCDIRMSICDTKYTNATTLCPIATLILILILIHISPKDQCSPILHRDQPEIAGGKNPRPFLVLVALITLRMALPQAAIRSFVGLVLARCRSFLVAVEPVKWRHSASRSPTIRLDRLVSSINCNSPEARRINGIPAPGAAQLRPG